MLLLFTLLLSQLAEAGGNERLSITIPFCLNSSDPKQVYPGRWGTAQRPFLLWVTFKDRGHFTIQTLNCSPPPVPGHQCCWAAGKVLVENRKGTRWK